MSDVPEWAQKEILRVHAKNLPELDLSREIGQSPLDSVPDEIFELTQLSELTLIGPYKTLPDGFGDLPQLTNLTLVGNYETVPESLGSLSHLVNLTLIGHYEVVPESLSNLTKLWSLTLGRTLSIVPPFILELPTLASLNIESTYIRILPREMFNLQNLEYLFLNKRLIETPPPEIIGGGYYADINAIRNYYRDLLTEEEDHLYEAKLLILGEGGAGKTSLARKIIDPGYELVSNEKSTEGIDVLHWGFALNNKQDFKVNLWDFGGQEIYHATHQFFLTNRSLYIIVADSRKEDTDFNYWLNIVELLGGESPVLIVKNEKQDRQRQIGEPQLRQRFKNIVEVLPTNLETNRNLERVIDAIRYQIEHLPHIGTPLPSSWVSVREKLENHDDNYITVQEYRAICDKCRLTDRSSQDTVIGYLHDLGVCLHFENDPLLKRWVILKPEWGTSAVYAVLDNASVHNNYGRFTRAQLDAIWTDPTYIDMRDELLELMMLFKLSYKIPGFDSTYIAPQLLSENRPSYNWNSNENLNLRYAYRFMPKGMVTRLIVAMHRYILDDLVWKTGVVLEHRDTRAEVVEHYHDRYIQICLIGQDKKSLLAIIMHELEEIHASYHGLKYDRLIPCNCEQCIDSFQPYYFKYEVLKRSLGETDFVQCQESFKHVDPRGLLDDVLPQIYLVDATPQEHFKLGDAQIETLIYMEQGHINMEHDDDRSEISIGGDVKGAGIIGGGAKLSGNAQITVNVGALQNAPPNSELAQLRALIEQLQAELAKVPAEHQEDAEAVAELASTAAEEAAKDKPNKTTLRITGEGLKAAAQNLKDVAPIAVQIAKILTGLG